MKVPSMMSWIGVRPRVFGGFALVLSFLVLLGGFAMVQVERIGGTVNELVTSAAGDAGMSQVRAALLSANGAVEKFIRTWNVGDRDAATQAIARVGQLTDQIERQFGTLPTIAEGVGPVRTSLETYRSSFAAATEAVDRLRAATTKTDAHGAVAGLNVGGIQVALANRSDPVRLINPMRLAAVVDALRITVMRYGNTLSTADADDAKLALGNVQLAIADTEAEIAGTAETKLKSLVTALKTAVAADAAALDEVVKVAGDLRSKQAELVKASAAIDEQVNKISTKLGAVRAEQGEKTAAAVQHTQQTVILSAAGALLLGAVLAWLIGTSLSGPIRRMTDRMQSLAAGELDEAIPGGESRDEIGRMARAVEVFRENALAVRRMEQEAAAQHGVSRGGSPAHDVRARQPLRAGHAGRDYGRRRPRRGNGPQRRGTGAGCRTRSRACRSGCDPRRAGVGQCSDGCFRDPATRRLDPRNIEPGAALGHGVKQGNGRDAADLRTDQRAVQRRGEDRHTSFS